MQIKRRDLKERSGDGEREARGAREEEDGGKKGGRQEADGVRQAITVRVCLAKGHDATAAAASM